MWEKQIVIPLKSAKIVDAGKVGVANGNLIVVNQSLYFHWLYYQKCDATLFPGHVVGQ